MLNRQTLYTYLMDGELVLVTFGAILGTALTICFELVLDRFRESHERKKVLRVLLEELTDNRKRAEDNRTNALTEMNRLSVAPTNFVTLLPLHTIGWDVIQSRGIITSLDSETIDRVRLLYSEIEVHNGTLAIRSGLISSGQISNLMYCDGLIHQTTSNIMTRIDSAIDAVKSKIR